MIFRRTKLQNARPQPCKYLSGQYFKGFVGKKIAKIAELAKIG